MDNVVLTGFMGTGKTTVGHLLATALGFDLVDTDELIERRHGPIPRIFETQGEQAFRKLEREIAAELVERHGLVIATGGGMLLDQENVVLLGATGPIVCLTATPETILARVRHDQHGPDRPLLAVSDPLRRITELLVERAPVYDRFLQVVTDGKSPDAVADEVLALVAPRD